MLLFLTASPFSDLEKATVLQECRVFSDSKVVTESPRKCSQLITKLLHIVTQGDAMSSSEVTEVFFGVTKLFQSSDASLRRMIYFFIKEVAETCNPDDIIIVTSSLTKDMNSKEDLFRANSIRVLAKMCVSYSINKGYQVELGLMLPCLVQLKGTSNRLL